MRVSLQIDGDASGAVKAAEDASAAISDISKHGDETSKALEEGFKKAAGALGDIKGASGAASAANDNLGSSIGAAAQKIADFASKTAGANSSLTKAASGAGSLAEGIGGVVRSAGGLSLLTGGIGIATTAISTFYNLASGGAEKVNKDLDEQSRLIGVVRDAYRSAASGAGEFFDESKKVTTALLSLNTISLKNDLDAAAKGIVSKLNFEATVTGIADLNNRGVGGGNGSPVDGEVRGFQALAAAKGAFDASVAAGAPDIKRFQDALADIVLKSQSADPALAALAGRYLDLSKSAGDIDSKIRRNNDGLAVLNGTATETQRRNVGISESANEAAGAFDRFAKSVDRQSAAQEAEAQAAGLSAGAAAKLRAEFVLTEAAQQSGAGAAAKYADQIAAIAARAGEAAQKLALAKLQSDGAFDRSQLGRTADEQAVASQLRGAFGDNADLNGSIASLVRTNNELKELKSTTQDLASGAFRDFRTELQAGATAFQALEKAGLNALQKIADKLADKAFDNAISGLFGSFLGGGGSVINANGSIAGAIGPTSVGGAPLVFDTGGYTGPGAKYDIAGFVHKDEFVFSKERTSQLGVGFLDRLHRGYADGGLVGGPAPWSGGSAAATNNSPTGGGVLQVHVTSDVNVSVDDDGKIRAYVKKTSADHINEFAGSRSFNIYAKQAVYDALIKGGGNLSRGLQSM